MSLLNWNNPDINACLSWFFETQAGGVLSSTSKEIIHKDLVLKTYKGASKKNLRDFGGDAVFLEKHLITIENEIASVASKHGLHDLLFWTRRIPPVNYMRASDATVLLYKQILDLAIKKYGTLSSDLVMKNGVLVPANIKYLSYSVSGVVPEEVKAILKACGLLEYLSICFVQTTQVYRNVNKGGHIVGDPLQDFIVELPSAKQDLVLLYDSRHYGASDLAGYIGTSVQIQASDWRECREVMSKSKFILFASPRNVIDDDSSDTGFSFLPMFMDASELASFVGMFSEEFEKNHKVSFKEVISFLDVLSRREVLDCLAESKWMRNLAQTGYIVVNPKQFVDSLVEYDNSLPQKSVERAFSLFTSCPDKINLWTRGPVSIFTKVSETNYILDYSCIFDALRGVTRFVGMLDGELGNIKSRHFEQKVCERIVSIFGEDSLWHRGELLRIDTGDKVEIDSAFVVGDVLYIAECKSVNVSIPFDLGKKDAVNFRVKKCQKGLCDADEKVKFILNNKGRLSRGLPKVRYVVPLVVTPFSEYVWHNSPWLYLSKKLPRLLNIEELGELVGLDIAYVRSQKYCRTLL